MIATESVQQDSRKQQQRVLLITSNVGSLFGEESMKVRKYWLDQIWSITKRACPAFVALHLQESGGKNYRHHSREMPGLVDELRKGLIEQGFVTSRCFLDIDHESIEEFTALSSVYFMHYSAIRNVCLYDFRQRKFEPITNDDKPLIISKEVNQSGLARKERFPPSFWSNFRWNRKGFLHTRWKIGSRVLDLINLHLFHDDSNLNFLEHPTEYSDNRRRALMHTLHKFEETNQGTLEGKSNCFLFGDFNFRLNLASFVKRLTKQTNEREIVLTDAATKNRGHSVSDSSSCGGNFSTVEQSSSSDETDEIRTSSCDDVDLEVDDTVSIMRTRKNSVIEYFRPPVVRELLSPKDRNESNWVLRIGKKRFEYYDSTWLIKEWKTYLEDDRELAQYPLKECQLNFPPTYPWNEEPNSPSKFMNTRAPAWCDRILFNENAQHLIRCDPKCEYQSFGREKCIGDHKPVMLLFSFMDAP